MDQQRKTESHTISTTRKNESHMISTTVTNVILMTTPLILI